MPYKYFEPPHFAPPRKHPPVALIVVVVLAVIVAGAYLVYRHDNRSSGGSSTLPSVTTGIPGSGGLTAAELTSNAKNQIIGPAPRGFAVKGVASVICNPPTSWTPGSTFTCFVYASNGTGLGQYDGTVEPNDSNGNYRWNAEWVPNG